MSELSSIRNFCIIAHIDHGKSTLADRLLEITHTVQQRQMKDQLLDSMDLERERGITIKLAPARMNWKGYTLHLIDTPGHVDFTYEVSRSLAAVEGAILLVDATQGVQAQTIGNLYLAMEQNLTILPVLNKIDLPAADVKKRTEELVGLLGCRAEDILCVSGKTGEGVEALLDAVVARFPSPEGNPTGPARALIFDSVYDDYKGIVAYVRVVDGAFRRGDLVSLLATEADADILEVGTFRPKYATEPVLCAGEIGYLVTGLKELSSCRVGDTIGTRSAGVAALPGYRQVRPMVFAGLFPKEGDAYTRLRDAMDKLKLNDASLQFEPEHSAALGFGFRCGFLGMLHLDIVRERLRREHGVEIIVTTPSVAYHVKKTNGEELVVKGPLDLPHESHVEVIEEPWARVDIVSPQSSVGSVMTLAQDRHAEYQNTEYLSSDQVVLHYDMPLSAIIVDFYDKLKSATAGYASLTYEVTGYRPADVVRLDILVADDAAEALASLVYRDDAERVGRRMVETLKESLPQQQFVVKLQASVGGKIVAAERLSALRKDVTAKLYGGDVTRKRKLLEKQKKGKAKMMAMGKGKVDIPASAYVDVLKAR